MNERCATLPVQVRGPPQLVSSWCLLSALSPILGSTVCGTAANGGGRWGGSEVRGREEEGTGREENLKSQGMERCKQLQGALNK